MYGTISERSRKYAENLFSQHPGSGPSLLFMAEVLESQYRLMQIVFLDSLNLAQYIGNIYIDIYIYICIYINNAIQYMCIYHV